MRAAVGTVSPGASSDAVDAVIAWFDAEGRDLPWRSPDRTPWGVLVCEVMSHQTPATRVVGPWREWLRRWPDPASLAADSPGEAVRMWGRLGYPRRALRLHEAARVIVAEHGGHVPRDVADLLRLPGVGPYTAAATAAFAHGARTVVLDVNVRRVLARLHGEADPGPGAPTAAERERAERALPPAPARSARWNAAAMELGALICTARDPACDACPVASRCPGPRAATGRSTRPQAWHGTDRQVRGLLLAALREATADVGAARLEAVWPDRVQVLRCLDGLVADGLAEPTALGFRLPR